MESKKVGIWIGVSTVSGAEASLGAQINICQMGRGRVLLQLQMQMQLLEKRNEQ
jgi:hypothetical protein